MAFNCNFLFMAKRISEKNMEKNASKNGFKQPLEKTPALKGKLFSSIAIVIYVVIGGFS